MRLNLLLLYQIIHDVPCFRGYGIKECFRVKMWWNLWWLPWRKNNPRSPSCEEFSCQQDCFLPVSLFITITKFVIYVSPSNCIFANKFIKQDILIFWVVMLAQCDLFPCKIFDFFAQEESAMKHKIHVRCMNITGFHHNLRSVESYRVAILSCVYKCH